MRNGQVVRRRWMRGAIVSACLLVLVASGTRPAHADDADQIVLEGLTLPCGGCSIVDGEECRVSLDHGTAAARCDRAVDRLLERRLDSGYDNTAPSLAELRQYLLKKELAQEKAVLPLALLMETPAGIEAFRLEASTYVTRYPGALATLISNGKGSAEAHQIIWKLPQSEGVPLDPKLRATLLASSPSLSLETVVSELSLANVQSDVDEIRMYAQALAGTKPEWSERLAELGEYVVRCEPRFRMSDGGPECGRDVIRPLPESFRRYAERVRIKATLEGISSEKPSVRERFERLVVLDFVNHSTPELFSAVSALLVEALKSDPVTRAFLVEDRGKRLFRQFVPRDALIARLYAELLIANAAEKWRAGDDAATLALVEESIESYGPELGSRRDLLFDLRGVKDLSMHPLTQSRIRELTEPLGAVQAAPSGDYQQKQTFLLITAMLLGGLAVGMFAKLQVEKIKRDQTDVEAALRYRAELAREQTELTELLGFFGFSVKPDETELMKSFRRMAKERHPDTDGGSHEAFAELQMKYDRLHELLAKRVE